MDPLIQSVLLWAYLKFHNTNQRESNLSENIYQQLFSQFLYSATVKKLLLIY